MAFFRWFLTWSLQYSPSALKWSDQQSSVILCRMIARQPIITEWRGVCSTSLPMPAMLNFGLSEIVVFFVLFVCNGLYTDALAYQTDLIGFVGCWTDN